MITGGRGRALHMTSIALCGAVGVHFVLFQEFEQLGSREHCFSPVRRYVFDRMDAYLGVDTLSSEEILALKTDHTVVTPATLPIA